jgi:hypothetical protein
MDRDWRGSIPRSPRYHTAIGRARPDPEKDPGDPHTRSLTHWLLHPRDLHLHRSKMADELLTGHLITHLFNYLILSLYRLKHPGHPMYSTFSIIAQLLLKAGVPHKLPSLES